MWNGKNQVILGQKSREAKGIENDAKPENKKAEKNFSSPK